MTSGTGIAPSQVEPWVLDAGICVEQIGEADLVRGWVEVCLAQAFLDRADVSRYHVLLTSCGDASLFVFNRGPRAFEIHARGARDLRPWVRCCYRVVARRAAGQIAMGAGTPEKRDLVSLAGEFRLLECTVYSALGRIAGPHGATHVEPRVMDVLVALARSAGRSVCRDDIIEAAWGHPNVTDEALSRCISLLRRALGDDPRNPRFIETVPKRGYRLLALVEVATAKPLHIDLRPFADLSGSARRRHLADRVTVAATVASQA